MYYIEYNAEVHCKLLNNKTYFRAAFHKFHKEFPKNDLVLIEIFLNSVFPRF